MHRTYNGCVGVRNIVVSTSKTFWQCKIAPWTCSPTAYGSPQHSIFFHSFDIFGTQIVVIRYLNILVSLFLLVSEFAQVVCRSVYKQTFLALLIKLRVSFACFYGCYFGTTQCLACSTSYCSNRGRSLLIVHLDM